MSGAAARAVREVGELRLHRHRILRQLVQIFV
jgi:hypothetical protein